MIKVLAERWNIYDGTICPLLSVDDKKFEYHIN